jgi:hypothetical protein
LAIRPSSEEQISDIALSMLTDGKLEATLAVGRGDETKE